MKRLLKSDVVLLAARLALLFVVSALCRIVFRYYNLAAIGPISASELPALLKGALRFDTVSILYANAAWILLSLFPHPFRERRWYRNLLYGYYVTVNSLLLVGLNLADAVYFRYTQKRFTADEVFFADNDNSVQLLLKFAAENMQLVLSGVLMIGLLAWGYRRHARTEPLSGNRWIRLGADTLALAGAALLTVAGIRGGFTRMTRPVTLSNAMLYASDNAKANLILSNPFCILRTVGSSSTVKYERYFDDERLEAIYSPVHRPAAAAAPAADSVPSRRNVVVFVLESFSAEHSAHLSPDLYAGREPKGYTPFLDSLMRNGYTFRRMYANGTRSIQALPAILGSIPSYKTPFVLLPQSLGRSRQLPAILRDEGYRTAFFCGSSPGSMGFEAYARSAGTERLFNRKSYEDRHGNRDFDGYWGIWDEPFLQYMGEELGALGEPFFASVFTLSSHHPFVVPRAYEASLPRGETRNHRPVAYTDNAIRNFFARYGSEPWFSRTVFLFVADHVSSEKFADRTRYFPENHRIVGFFYCPDGSLRGEDERIAAQIDLMPTLLALLGYDQSYFAFGRNLMRPQTGSSEDNLLLTWDNGFEALLRDTVILFDGHRITGVYRSDDLHRTRDLSAATDLRTVEERIKAMIQQYYAHIERKDFTTDSKR